MDGITTTLTYLKRGNLADLPDAAALHALIHPNALVLFSAEDAGSLLKLNRTTVDWDIVAAGGGGSPTPGALNDPLLSDGAGGFVAGDRTGSSTTVMTSSGDFDDTTIPMHDELSGNFINSGITLADIIVDADIGSSVAAAPSGAANTPLFDNGAGGFTNGTTSGNTLDVATTDGSLTDGNFASVDSDGNLKDSGIPVAGVAPFAVEAHTTNYSILPADNGKRFNNDGAIADMEYDLPEADGTPMRFGFAVLEAFYERVNAFGTDVVSVAADDSASGGYVRSNVTKSYLILESHRAGEWVASSMVGAWGVDV